MMGHAIEHKEIGDTLGTQEEVNRYNGHGPSPDMTAYERAKVRLECMQLAHTYPVDFGSTADRMKVFAIAESIFAYVINGFS
jgi:hypothetical protein